ncbi:MAG: single-stranded-DNA-specific exonuclease RecJ [Paludibacter sp.]|nr:single-stranded-DNA-specific exonuclease RecJ [Bacteroidales bacterium]MCM1068577.1 single-stranded-DNA-specific exonuclease RecJ [Prevotella sp.]MCM1353241.1 single-stranded-DNA-specific exonuclease RecJ [Bacteroides sp.]MCM1442351.1 single-stranded-DNA-specific exonuclease RecJ [Muribaculum sp.]MCM1481170.1 single-stranded-DNA-specific exonuclease RecJ [Paludibacter sp.]
MQTIWHIRALNGKEMLIRDKLARELCISEASASLLVRRGLYSAESARRFIAPSLTELHDPFLMKDMEKAVMRLSAAVENNERILVYGDYDVDGTTAVALVCKFLATHYNNFDFYIPDRYQEGYGISYQGVDYAVEHKCGLIIALDCGIRSMDKVEYARSCGVDFIICDHHLPAEEIPCAVAVLDPKRTDCAYPCKDLSGCGVGFKLVQAFAERQGIGIETLCPLLELTAMSIASDIVPVTGENRVLAYHGLKQMRRSPLVGVQSLLQQAGVTPNEVTFADLMYKIGPRLNACGRIKSGRDAVSLLLTETAETALLMGKEIEEHNTTRKGLDQQITLEALQQLAEEEDNVQRCSTVVCGKDWHKGVIGIVASRLTEYYYRPTIVLTESDGIVSGSARSVGGFDIYSAIDSCRDLLENFGGHVFAAGLSMKSENYTQFCRRFEEYVSAHILQEQRQPYIDVESELSLGDITSQFVSVVEHLEPCGPGNPRPVFVSRNLFNYRYTRAVGKSHEHLRLDVTDGRSVLSGIAFGQGQMESYFRNGNRVDVCYTLEKNTFRGNTSVQMMVQDIHRSTLEE